MSSPCQLKRAVLPDGALHVLRRERLQERLQLLVGEPGEQPADTARDPQVRTEAGPPAPFIGTKVARLEPVASQGLGQRLGREQAREQAVEDAASRRRLGQTRGIPYREDAMAVATPGRCEG